MNLQVVHIFFDSPTFDKVQKDAKVTLVGALGLIGGTMGLFTGFSILSGIEILYYLAKFFFSLRLNKTEYQKKAQNQR